jgi:hypothetical protein
MIGILTAPLAVIGRSVLGPSRRHGARRDLFRHVTAQPRLPPALVPARTGTAASPHRLALPARRGPDRVVHRRRARAPDLRRRRALQRRGRGAADRRHRHHAGTRPRPRRPHGRRPRRRRHRRRDRHHEGDRADRRAGHAVHQPDEIPRRAPRAGRHPVAAASRRGRRQHRHLSAATSSAPRGSASTRPPISRTRSISSRPGTSSRA